MPNERFLNSGKFGRNSGIAPGNRKTVASGFRDASLDFKTSIRKRLKSESWQKIFELEFKKRKPKTREEVLTLIGDFIPRIVDYFPKIEFPDLEPNYVWTEEAVRFFVPMTLMGIIASLVKLDFVADENDETIIAKAVDVFLLGTTVGVLGIPATAIATLATLPTVGAAKSKFEVEPELGVYNYEDRNLAIAQEELEKAINYVKAGRFEKAYQSCRKANKYYNKILSKECSKAAKLNIISNINNFINNVGSEKRNDPRVIKLLADVVDKIKQYQLPSTRIQHVLSRHYYDYMKEFFLNKKNYAKVLEFHKKYNSLIFDDDPEKGEFGIVEKYQIIGFSESEVIKFHFSIIYNYFMAGVSYYKVGNNSLAVEKLNKVIELNEKLHVKFVAKPSLQEIERDVITVLFMNDAYLGYASENIDQSIVHFEKVIFSYNKVKDYLTLDYDSLENTVIPALNKLIENYKKQNSWNKYSKICSVIDEVAKASPNHQVIRELRKVMQPEKEKEEKDVKNMIDKFQSSSEVLNYVAKTVKLPDFVVERILQDFQDEKITTSNQRKIIAGLIIIISGLIAKYLYDKNKLEGDLKVERQELKEVKIENKSLKKENKLAETKISGLNSSLLQKDNNIEGLSSELQKVKKEHDKITTRLHQAREMLRLIKIEKKDASESDREENENKDDEEEKEVMAENYEKHFDSKSGKKFRLYSVQGKPGMRIRVDDSALEDLDRQHSGAKNKILEMLNKISDKGQGEDLVLHDKEKDVYKLRLTIYSSKFRVILNSSKDDHGNTILTLNDTLDTHRDIRRRRSSDAGSFGISLKLQAENESIPKHKSIDHF